MFIFNDICSRVSAVVMWVILKNENKKAIEKGPSTVRDKTKDKSDYLLTR